MKPLKPLLVLAAFFTVLGVTNAQAASMTVSSSSFKDVGAIPKLMAGSSVECGNGQATTPGVNWANLPQGAQSIAVLLVDPDGGKGQGVVHWVAYNIPAAGGHLEQGAAPHSVRNVTVGVNSAGAPTYRGLCPPAGDTPHHYVLTVIATDQSPGSLPDGLDRASLLNAIKDHSLSAQSVVGRYGH